MTKKPKFLFDSCCFGRNTLNKLIEFLGTSGDGAEFAHLSDFQLQDKLDDEWLPEIVNDKWIVITSDRGMRPSKGSKLPPLCKALGITHILLSASIHNLTTFEKARAVVAVWSSVMTVAEWPVGTEHRLQKTVSGGYVLKSPPKPAGDDAPKRQQEFIE